MVRVRSGVVSITGDFRENNEDNAVADPKQRFFLVADGMGGHAAGEKASSLAVELIPQKLTQALQFDGDAPDRVTDAIDRAVEFANSEIMALGQVDPAYNQMGTTVAILVNDGEMLFVGGVGDSRVYRLSGGKFEQLTTDHSLTQALRDAGTISEEEARNHRYKNVLYRYLGTKDGGRGADCKPVKPVAGDRFLLCSDGVTDGCEPAKISELLAAASDPQQAAESVVKAAQDGGSRDNITCLVVFVDE
ncbi:MAG: protein phosphatase 2C domain-containing protein [Planctomycetota bacterium]|nr:protein phosphatase 2C domain-containing protein [Planctomycetota bacterium]